MTKQTNWHLEREESALLLLVPSICCTTGWELSHFMARQFATFSRRGAHFPPLFSHVLMLSDQVLLLASPVPLIVGRENFFFVFAASKMSNDFQRVIKARGGGGGELFSRLTVLSAQKIECFSGSLSLPFSCFPLQLEPCRHLRCLLLSLLGPSFSATFGKFIPISSLPSALKDVCTYTLHSIFIQV